MVITSVQNSKVKKLRALKTKKGRQKYSQYLIEGVNIIKDLPPNADVDELYIKKSCYERLVFLEEKLDIKAQIVEDKIFDSIADTKTPNGAIAIANPLQEQETEGDIVILLDNISDAGNLGTILRSAAARNIHTVLLYGNCADVYSPKAVRASMGGIFYINLRKANDNDIDALIQKGYQIVGLDMAGKNIYDYKKDKKIIIAVGNEAHGLDENIKSKCKDILSIPIDNVESLNAAISLSIALYII